MRRKVAVILVTAALVASACGGDPSVDDWAQGWAEARADIPPLEVLQGDGHEEVCSTALGDIRQWVADLERAPNMAIGDAFLDWAEFAEAIFQECPINSGPHAGFDASYEELHRLASEVEALIEFERGLDG